MIALLRARPALSPGLVRSLRLVSLTMWIATVLFGMGRIWNYERTPTPVAPAPSEWPRATRLSASANGFTLVIAVHPSCPCTRAGVGELARIMASTPHPTAVYVLFYTPKALPPDWKETGLRDQIAAIPGVTAIQDEDGQEAARFHATVSGQTLLFDAARHLRFSGGITAGRGVEGDNPGREAILALLRGQQTAQTRFPVFGCSLITRR